MFFCLFIGLPSFGIDYNMFEVSQYRQSIMTDLFKYAFLDESGTVAPFSVDFIAWAFFQKYERGDNRFYEIIQKKVVVEELIERRLW